MALLTQWVTFAFAHCLCNKHKPSKSYTLLHILALISTPLPQKESNSKSLLTQWCLQQSWSPKVLTTTLLLFCITFSSKLKSTHVQQTLKSNVDHVLMETSAVINFHLYHHHLRFRSHYHSRSILPIKLYSTTAKVHLCARPVWQGMSTINSASQNRAVGLLVLAA